MPEQLLLVLTHDVDWPRRGPPREHVLARLHRFLPEDRLRFLERGENIYYGVELLVEHEERAGLRSTFFFRPAYDDGSSVEEYADALRVLRSGGWEIGLHANNGWDLAALSYEKKTLESAAGTAVVSVRAHMLKLDVNLIPKLPEIGLMYDSSLCFSRHAPSLESAGCVKIGDVIELPITVMDAYLFTYWGVKPGHVVEKIFEVLEEVYRSGLGVATVLWHDNSVRMIGGREYLNLLEEVHAAEWLQAIRVDEVAAYILKGRLKCREVRSEERS